MVNATFLSTKLHITFKNTKMNLFIVEFYPVLASRGIAISFNDCLWICNSDYVYYFSASVLEIILKLQSFKKLAEVFMKKKFYAFWFPQLIMKSYLLRIGSVNLSFALSHFSSSFHNKVRKSQSNFFFCSSN